MKLTFDMGGLKALAKKFEGMADVDAGIQQAKKSAEIMTKNAKANVYRPGLLTYRDGMIRDSLHAVVEADDSSISFGVETNNMIAIYHELGTGPVGTAAGYPGEGMTDEPIVRKSKGWVYWSDAVYQNRLEDLYDSAGTYTVLPQEINGFVYTEGVPPKAFMFNAVLDKAEQETRKIVKAMMGGADRGG